MTSQQHSVSRYCIQRSILFPRVKSQFWNWTQMWILNITPIRILHHMIVQKSRSRQNLISIPQLTLMQFLHLWLANRTTLCQGGRSSHRCPRKYNTWCLRCREELFNRHCLRYSVTVIKRWWCLILVIFLLILILEVIEVRIV